MAIFWGKPVDRPGHSVMQLCWAWLTGVGNIRLDKSCFLHGLSIFPVQRSPQGGRDMRTWRRMCRSTARWHPIPLLKYLQLPCGSTRPFHMIDSNVDPEIGSSNGLPTELDHSWPQTSKITVLEVDLSVIDTPDPPSSQYDSHTKAQCQDGAT